jgi:hypothetical protein
MFELFAIFILVALAVLAVKVFGFVLHLLLLPLKLAAGIFLAVLFLPLLLLGLPFLILAGVGVMFPFSSSSPSGIAAIAGSSPLTAAPE